MPAFHILQLAEDSIRANLNFGHEPISASVDIIVLGDFSDQILFNRSEALGVAIESKDLFGMVLAGMMISAESRV